MAYVDQTADYTCNARPFVRRSGLESFNHDGVMVARYRRRRIVPHLPWKHLALFALLAMSLRVVTYSDLGPAGYADRAKNLLDGTMPEQVISVVMKMDAVTEHAAWRLRYAARSLSGLIS